MGFGHLAQIDAPRQEADLVLGCSVESPAGDHTGGHDPECIGDLDLGNGLEKKLLEEAETLEILEMWGVLCLERKLKENLLEGEVEFLDPLDGPVEEFLGCEEAQSFLAAFYISSAEI